MVEEADLRRPLKLSLHSDPDVENPCDAGGWRIFTFKRRDGGDANVAKFHNEKGLRAEYRKLMDRKLAFYLNCYDHGGVSWSITGGPVIDQWDVAVRGGIAVWQEGPKKCWLKTYKAREENLASFLETYSSWCNGDTYCYSLKCLATDEVVESCGGWIGDDGGMASEIVRAVKALEGVIVKIGGDRKDMIQYFKGVEVEDEFEWSGYGPDNVAIVNLLPPTKLTLPSGGQGTSTGSVRLLKLTAENLAEAAKALGLDEKAAANPVRVLHALKTSGRRDWRLETVERVEAGIDTSWQGGLFDGVEDPSLQLA